MPYVAILGKILLTILFIKTWLASPILKLLDTGYFRALLQNYRSPTTENQLFSKVCQQFLTLSVILSIIVLSLLSRLEDIVIGIIILKSKCTNKKFITEDAPLPFRIITSNNPSCY